MAKQCKVTVGWRDFRSSCIYPIHLRIVVSALKRPVVSGRESQLNRQSNSQLLTSQLITSRFSWEILKETWYKLEACCRITKSGQFILEMSSPPAGMPKLGMQLPWPFMAGNTGLLTSAMSASRGTGGCIAAPVPLHPTAFLNPGLLPMFNPDTYKLGATSLALGMERGRLPAGFPMGSIPASMASPMVAAQFHRQHKSETTSRDKLGDLTKNQARESLQIQVPHRETNGKPILFNPKSNM